MFEQYMSMIRREVERTVQKLIKRPRLGLVSAYDPDKHAVKVQLQPEGTMTGWIPLTSMSVGNGFGVAFAPNIKDQVEINFDSGDHQSARVMTRHFSKEDKAPRLEAGEFALIHGSGSQIKQSKDGTVTIAGAGAVAVGKTGGGKSGDTGTGSQGATAGQDADQEQPTKTQGKNSITLKPTGEIVVQADSKEIVIQATNSPVFLITSDKVKSVTNKNAAVLPVQLVGGIAKNLFAESV